MTAQDQQITQLQVPPHSVEAEQALLGGLLLDNRVYDDLADRVMEQDFYRLDHRLVFHALVALAEQGQPFDVITVSEYLDNRDELDKAGGLAYLGELAKNTPSASNIGAYADIVRERAIFRELIGVANQIAGSAIKPEGRASHQILDQAEQQVFAIADARAKSDSAPKPITEVIATTIDKIEELFSRQSEITGLSTGFDDLDKLTSGLQPGDMVVVAGRPSMGKTTFSMNLAENAAINSGKPVLIFSMEMPSESIVMRMLSSLGRIEQQKIRSGQLGEEDWPRVTSAIGLLSEKAKMYIDDAGGLSPAEVRAKARRIAREHGQLGLIVLDYLQLMQVPNHSENRTAEISEISRSLKALAKELNVPVIALSQLNRGLEQRPNKRPVMSDLRESGAIEQDADVIMFIYRDEVYNPESEAKGTAEIIIGKQRNGPIGTVRLTFLGKYTRFENYTGAYIEGPDG